MMRAKIRRYWFNFNNLPLATPLTRGCGVSAYSYQDAMSILHEKIFPEFRDIVIESFEEDVDIRLLDQRFVITNMGDVSIRGVWYPIGYV